MTPVPAALLLPAVALVPPVPALLVDVPAVPVGVFELMLQAPEISPNAVAVAITRAADWIFIEGFFRGIAGCRDQEIGWSAATLMACKITRTAL